MAANPSTTPSNSNFYLLVSKRCPDLREAVESNPKITTRALAAE